MRVAGHGLRVTWDKNPRYARRTSTGECLCGWTHTARTRNHVRAQYYRHRYEHQNPPGK